MAKAADNVTQTTDDAGWETVVEPFAETYSFETPGDSLTGVFVSKRSVEMPDLNNPGQMRDTNVYEIVDENEKKWSVWGSYNIDQAFEKIEPESMVRVIFVNKVPIDGGARTVKQFTVQTKKQ